MRRLPGKKILIGDNLSSHLSVESIKLCQEENISFVFLPSNSTHLTQPLDIAFFRPLKIGWRQILLKWKKGPGMKEPSLPKSVFPRLLATLLNKIEANAADNIKSGFKKAGLIPLDRSQVLKCIPDDFNENPDK
ncbi:DDE superfamily endonuclease [Popillia japonica]|uniref:DDE superfamily endonuclease n=1 Tax=Popillia japonica TaxID=7064 RepID=A0AAW1MGA8_POPJA